MIKFIIRTIIIIILINNNCFANYKEQYVYLDAQECQIAIPFGFHISGNFTEKSIVFFKNKEININTFKNNQDKIEKNFNELFGAKNINFIKGNVRNKVKLLIKTLDKNQITLLKEKKIGYLSYQKFKSKITDKIIQYEYYIYGKSFFIGAHNIEEKYINYMIKHCNETYKINSELK